MIKKNFIFLTILYLTVILSSACKYPDNLPNWQDLASFKLEKLQFNKTSLNDFKKLTKEDPSQKVGSNIDIFNTVPIKKNIYNKIRIGFKDKKLDWIEYLLDQNIEMSKFVEIYGKPREVNSKYSKLYDYYDYGFFNVMTDKNHTSAKSVTLFEIYQSTVIKPSPESVVKEGQDISFRNFLGLKPGMTLEDDFIKSYPTLKPHKSDKFDTRSTYFLEEELGGAKSMYKKAVIVFNNGLLSWINLVPQSLSIYDAEKRYGKDYKVEHMDYRYNLYDFTTFVLVVNKTTKKVVNVGIVSAD